MKTQDKILNVSLTILGFVLVIWGIGTPGLFPWQLPACFLGGLMIGKFLPNVISMFKGEKRNKFGRTKDEQDLHDWMENNPR